MGNEYLIRIAPHRRCQRQRKSSADASLFHAHRRHQLKILLPSKVVRTNEMHLCVSVMSLKSDYTLT